MIVICCFIQSLSWSQSGLDVEPGVDRWEVKTTAAKLTETTKPRHVVLETLLRLPLMAPEYSKSDYDDKLIPKSPAPRLKEGDIITTEGYMHLVALERASDTHKDGDYHIQITLSPEWTDSCFIVEIPYKAFAKNKDLKDLCEKNRLFIRKRILKKEDKEPSPGGNVMKGIAYVRVTGQLFYDAIHASQMRNKNPDKRKYRGKKGTSEAAMHSYTAWEIHPVTDIIFWPRPK
ncbi:MAG: hypothetical protein ACJ76F_10050 [Bacteroidia bacterium]